MRNIFYFYYSNTKYTICITFLIYKHTLFKMELTINNSKYTSLKQEYKDFIIHFHSYYKLRNYTPYNSNEMKVLRDIINMLIISCF